MIDMINLNVDCLLILTTGVTSYHFVNLSMVTYRYRYPPMTLRNGPRMSIPHTVNGHEGGIICSICTSVWNMVQVQDLKILFQLQDME
jgi:hypothetical protein